VVNAPNTSASSEYQKAFMLVTTRINLRTFCGVDNQAEIDAGQAIIKAGDPFYNRIIARLSASRRAPTILGDDPGAMGDTPQARSPVNCTTMRLDRDVSTTNCN
jgi:hypothetical protein